MDQILFELFKDQYSSHIKTSQLICSANHFTGFSMRGTLVVKGFNWIVDIDIKKALFKRFPLK